MATVKELQDMQAAEDPDRFPDDDFPEEPEGSVEGAADGGDDAPQEPEEPRVQGTKVARQLSLLAGGEEPDSSSFKMRGGSVAVEGEFVKGDVVKLLVTLTVDEVHFIDKKDKDGYVVGTERRHIAKPLSIQRQ